MNHDTIMRIIHDTEQLTLSKMTQKTFYFLSSRAAEVMFLSVTSLTGLGPTIVNEESPIYPNYSKGPIWSRDSIHTPTKIIGVSDMKNDDTSWLFSNRTKYSLCWNIQLNLFIGESVQNRAGNTKSSCMQ